MNKNVAGENTEGDPGDTMKRIILLFRFSVISGETLTSRSEMEEGTVNEASERGGRLLSPSVCWRVKNGYLLEIV